MRMRRLILALAVLAYGRASIFKTFIGVEAPRITRFDFSNVTADTDVLMRGAPHVRELRQGMLLHGVDLMRPLSRADAAAE